MPLNIKNPEADRLARELTEVTGESITDAVIVAIRERLERERGRGRRVRLCYELAGIRERYQQLRVVDPRSPEEIIG